MIQNYGENRHLARAFQTGEDIGSINLIRNTVVLAIVDKRSNSIGMYEIEELRYRNSDDGVREVQPFYTPGALKCSANQTPNMLGESSEKCKCQRGTFFDSFMNRCTSCHEFCLKNDKECRNEFSCTKCYLSDEHFNLRTKRCESTSIGLFIDKEQGKPLPCPDPKCESCD